MREKTEKELKDKVGRYNYFNLNINTVSLDGRFSSEQLRNIADILDKYIKQNESQTL